MQNNPFLNPAFEIEWSALTPDQIEPAIETALGEAKASVDAIASQDIAGVTYENTFRALENATEDLNMHGERCRICNRSPIHRRCGRRTARCCRRSRLFHLGFI